METEFIKPGGKLAKTDKEIEAYLKKKFSVDELKAIKFTLALASQNTERRR
jgi:hypothetical protein